MFMFGKNTHTQGERLVLPSFRHPMEVLKCTPAYKTTTIILNWKGKTA